VTKAIIFDCFGVLIGRGFERTYRMAGGNPVRDRTFIENTLGQANLGLISDAEFRTIMARQVGIGTERLNTELFTYIKQLRALYKTAILSNANKGVLDRIIGEKRLQKYFDEVVVSAEIGIAKPDNRIYKLVADRLGVKTRECLYVDDREIFLDPARQLGMSVLLYEDFDQIKRSMSKLLG
jgi:putative hydrolase of the HAD superfamily